MATLDIIKKALADLKDYRKGSSLPAIKKWIAANEKVRTQSAVYHTFLVILLVLWIIVLMKSALFWRCRRKIKIEILDDETELNHATTIYWYITPNPTPLRSTVILPSFLCSWRRLQLSQDVYALLYVVFVGGNMSISILLRCTPFSARQSIHIDS